MFRALWFMIQIALLVAAGFWIFNRPGSVHIDWLGYNIDAHIGVAFVALVGVVIAALCFYKITGFLFSLPRRLVGARGKKRRDRGFRSLTLGLSAVSAGDAKLASYHAYRMRQFLPDERGLPWLLEAQAARLRGDEASAAGYFEKLLKDKDTSFLGVRGLLQTAIDSADLDGALTLARQAMAMHPDQPWIIRTVFGLELQKREWAAALTTLKRGERAKAWPAAESTGNRIAILLQQGDELSRAGYVAEAARKLKDAWRLDHSYVPAALRLARHHIEHGKRRQAIAVIERVWRDHPHPDLAALWESLAPANKPKDMALHLRWYERLVALRPGDAESQLAAARAAINDGLWGEAWQYLSAAEKIRPNARLYRLWAQMEEKTSHGEAAKRYWEKAADAPADKVWTCRETGRIYDHWSPIAEPHGSFNTIVWDYPMIARRSVDMPALAANDLVIDPVRIIASPVSTQ